MKGQRFDKLTALLGELRPGEGRLVLLLGSNLTVALLCYYILKTVREPLILATGGAELKTYAAGVQALVLMGVVPAYAWLTGRYDRYGTVRRLVLGFVVCIEAFFVLVSLGVPLTGVLFYVWVGIFSLVLVAQFWSVANDLMSKEQGERLFPIVAIGAATGSLAGSFLASWLFAQGLGAEALLQLSAGLLVVHLGLYERTERSLQPRPGAASGQPHRPPAMKPGNGFRLVFGSSYILLIAVLLLLLNLVNTVGEYVLADLVRDAAQEAYQRSGAQNKGRFIESFIGKTYGTFYSFVNVVTLLLQAFVASRLVKWGGARAVLLALPAVALGTYALAFAGAGFAVFRWAKTAENGTDYSIMNTGKALLWLPTTREEKYRAKQMVDTFFVRTGDVAAAGVVYVGLTYGFARHQFALINLVAVCVWLGVALLLARRYHEHGPAIEPQAAAEHSGPDPLRPRPDPLSRQLRAGPQPSARPDPRSNHRQG